MGDSMNDIFAKRLKELRKARGLQQWKLAEISGVPQYNISRYERSVSPISNVNSLVCLASALRVSTDYLLGLTDQESNTYQRDGLGKTG